MTDRNAIQQAVLNAITTLNETMSEEEQIPLDPSAALAKLDSLAVTNLLVAVEQAVQDALNAEISMTDEQTLELILSAEATPLHTVQSLVEYVGRLLDEAGS